MLEFLRRLLRPASDWHPVDILFADRKLIDGTPAGSGPVMRRTVAGKTEYRRMTDAEVSRYLDETGW